MSCSAQVGARGRAADGRADAGHVAHVAVLAGRDDAAGLVAGELGLVDPGARVLAGQPLAVGALDGEHVAGVAVRVRRVQGLQIVGAVAAALDEDRVADVVAGAAEAGARGGTASAGTGVRPGRRRRGRDGPGRDPTRSRRWRGSVGTCSRSARMSASAGGLTPSTYTGSTRRWQKHAVDALVVLGDQGIARGVEGAALGPAVGRVATQAEIAHRRGHALGHAQRRQVQGIAHGLGHHAALPVVPVFGVRIVVAVAGDAGLGRVVGDAAAEGLGAGQVEVAQGGRCDARGAAVDAEGPAAAAALVAGIVHRHHAQDGRAGQVRDEQCVAPGVLQALGHAPPVRAPVVAHVHGHAGDAGRVIGGPLDGPVRLGVDGFATGRRCDQDDRRIGVRGPGGSQEGHEFADVDVERGRVVGSLQAGEGGRVAEIRHVRGFDQVLETVVVRVLLLHVGQGLVDAHAQVEPRLQRDAVGIALAAPVEVEVADAAVGGVAGQIVQLGAVGRRVAVEEAPAERVAGLRRNRGHNLESQNHDGQSGPNPLRHNRASEFQSCKIVTRQRWPTPGLPSGAL